MLRRLFLSSPHRTATPTIGPDLLLLLLILLMLEVVASADTFYCRCWP